MNLPESVYLAGALATAGLGLLYTDPPPRWREMVELALAVTIWPVAAAVFFLWGRGHHARRWLCVIRGHRWRPVVRGYQRAIPTVIYGRQCQRCWLVEEVGP